jgi:hypothetical protein
VTSAILIAACIAFAGQVQLADFAPIAPQ